MKTLEELVKGEVEGIAKAEEELKVLGKLPSQPVEVGGRVRYLLEKLMVAQDKVEKYERESKELKRLLQQEF